MSGFSADIGDNIYYSDSPKLKKAKVNHLLCKKTHNPSYFQKISKHFLSKGKYLHLKLTRLQVLLLATVFAEAEFMITAA